MGRTPEVLLFPLLLVTTPTLDGAVLAFKFWLTFALVWTTPFFGVVLSLAVFPLLQASFMPTAASRESITRVRFMYVPFSEWWLAINLLAAISFPIFLE